MHTRTEGRVLQVTQTTPRHTVITVIEGRFSTFCESVNDSRLLKILLELLLLRLSVLIGSKKLASQLEERNSTVNVPA